MLLFSSMVAGSFTFGSLTANLVHPVAFQALRFGFAAAVVGLLGLATRQIRLSDARAPWRWLFLGATFSTYFVLMFEGLKTAPPVSASAVMTLMPIMTAVFSWVILRQVTTRRIAIALGIGAVGALWVIFRGDIGRLLALDVGRGEAIYFVGCIAHALYVPLLRWLTRGESAVSSSFWVLTSGTLVLVAYGWGPLTATDFASLPPIVWIALAYLSVGAMAVTFVCLNFASVRLVGAKVMAYTYLTPGWVILWELAFGHGLPDPHVLAGLVLTAVAIVLLLKHEA
ncbi:DMT family transporter [Maritimibacter sp. DP1N21-5]|uniref:DMT family transporter n=1 Tax=Maritimibacter sp. DP1N21-5 TaxID=2836867 RepID=UPI001C4979CE|nr:DMT family transporter [Maritimibacter sp. DP1N21-5]MBV7408009.1 DMT family transporter [Maritimibacter sp. DP1N21-5]